MADERISVWKQRYAEMLEKYNTWAASVGEVQEEDKTPYLLTAPANIWQSAFDCLRVKYAHNKGSKHALTNDQLKILDYKKKWQHVDSLYQELLKAYTKLKEHTVKGYPIHIGGDLTASQGFRWQAVTIA